MLYTSIVIYLIVALPITLLLWAAVVAAKAGDGGTE
jgi:hypothetical protein